MRLRRGTHAALRGDVPFVNLGLESYGLMPDVSIIQVVACSNRSHCSCNQLNIGSILTARSVALWTA